MLKLLVFDWDGTLADSVPKIIECKRAIAQQYGVRIPSDETIKDVLGMGFNDAFARCFPDVEKKVLLQMGEAFHQLMQKDDYKVSLFPDAKKVLNMLKIQNMKLAIATSKNKKGINKALFHHDLATTFDIVCCGNEYPSKPNPSMLNDIMSALSIKPEECLMVGDTTTDILFAQNANVKIICTTFGAHSKTRLAEMDPLAFIHEWTQLHGVIQNLCYLNPIFSPSS